MNRTRRRLESDWSKQRAQRADQLTTFCSASAYGLMQLRGAALPRFRGSEYNQHPSNSRATLGGVNAREATTRKVRRFFLLFSCPLLRPRHRLADSCVAEQQAFLHTQCGVWSPLMGRMVCGLPVRGVRSTCEFFFVSPSALLFFAS